MIQQLLIDGHVHVHPCFDEETFLSAALANFARAGAGMPVLLLAETPDADVFSKWQSEPVPSRVTRTKEPTSLVLDGRLLVVAGRQIVTRENLEVLALCCLARFRDGMPLLQTIEQVISSGALCVLPWGVGKWTGTRAALVRAVLDSTLAKDMFLGDNGNRLSGTDVPRLLRAGSAQDIRIIAGSDPLPLKSHQFRAGTYGTVLEGDFGLETPAADLCTALRSGSARPRTFGRLTGLLDFCKSQFAMQRRKWHEAPRST